MKHLVIVGSGIAGLAHAALAREAGWQVTVLERSARPRGASVRNFGTLWPIGQPRGPRRMLALRSMARWRRYAEAAGLWMNPCGSLHLAYLDEGWAVLQEYAAAADERLDLLDPEATRARFPAVQTDGLQGALYSPSEAVVQPAAAIDALVRWLRAEEVTFRFETTALVVEEQHVVISGGDRLAFDRLVVCSGHELAILYPEILQASGAQRCQLQMMCAAPPVSVSGAAWSPGAVLAADLTLRHYESFADCPSLPALRRRLQDEMPFYEDWGIHVLVAQHPDGSLALGDSHEDGPAPTIGSRTEVDTHVLDYLRSFCPVPELRVDRRWTGSYLKPPPGEYVLRYRPAPGVDVVTGLGGAGMTLSFGIAEQTLAAW